MRYRREIDGLRAVAVLPVIAFHAGLAPFGGGFVGVDVFFVISGYLITGIVWPEVTAGRFSLLRFYERRARRILPALTLVCLATVAGAVVLLPPADIAELLRSLTAVALFSSNFYFWGNATYFAPAAELAPLLHTWSLGVEEQFYLVFPLLLLLLRRRSARSVAAILVALGAASLLLAEVVLPLDPAAAFYLLPTRAWELCAGAVLALLPEAPARAGARLAGSAALAGLAMIAAAVFAYGPATPFPGVAALLPVGGTALVIAFARPGTLAGAALSLPPLVGIGLVSYSAYLWHQPLLALARAASPEPLGDAAALALAALSLGLAVPTWLFVERPFRDPARIGRRGVLAAAVASVAGLALVGALGRAPLTAASLLAYDADQRRVLDMIAAAKRDEQARGRTEAETGCRFWTPALDAAVAARLSGCAQTHGRGTLVVGDSHAIDLYRAFVGASAAPFLVGLSDGGCRLGAADPCFYDDLPTALAAAPGLRVVFAQAGMYLLHDGDGGPGNRRMFDRHLTAPLARDADAIAAAADYLDTLPADVAWYGPWIEPHVSERALVARGCADPPAPAAAVEASIVGLDRALARAAAARRFRYVSLLDALAFDPARDIIDCTALYYADSDHWSRAGEARFGARLRAAGLIEEPPPDRGRGESRGSPPRPRPAPG